MSEYRTKVIMPNKLLTDALNKLNVGGDNITLRDEIDARITKDLPKLEIPGCGAKHMQVPYVDLDNPCPTIVGLPSGREIFYPLHKDETFINRFDFAH